MSDVESEVSEELMMSEELMIWKLEVFFEWYMQSERMDKKPIITEIFHLQWEFHN